MTVSFVGEGPLASACFDQLVGFKPQYGFAGGDLLVSVHYSEKVPGVALNRFRLSVNLHTGLLPLNKGVHTFAAPILRGDARTGVTIHEMTDRIDCGDIILQDSYPILPSDTCQSLHDKAMVAGVKLFADFLDVLRQPESIDALMRLRRPQVGTGYRTLSSDIDFHEVIAEGDPLADRKKRAYFFPSKQFPEVLRNGQRFLLTSLFPEVLQHAPL